MTPEELIYDVLRTPGNMFDSDPRNAFFVRLDEHGVQKPTLDQHHADVAAIRLLPAVPGAVQFKFETAKNVYLYAWFVYRFFPIAEQQVLACLELGLRLRFPAALPKKYWKRRDRPPTLRPLLEFAIDSKVIRNEGFRRWHDQVERRARARYDDEKLREMLDGNLDSIEVDYTDLSPTDDDRDWDYLAILLATLPNIRNAYAHGSPMLHNRVLGTVELVGEMLNQLFPDESNAN